MSVVSCNRLFTSRGGTDTHLNHRTYRDVWEVLTNSVADNEQTVGAAVGLPQVGQPHPDDPTCYMVGVEAAQSEDTPFLWYVTCKFDSKPELPEAFDPGEAGAEPGDREENPLDRPPVWSVNFTKTTEPAIRWYPVSNLGVVAEDLSLVRNSAKLPFDPPATIEVSRPIIRVVKNIAPAAATLEFFATLQDSVNELLWRGLHPRTARIDGVSGQGKFENAVRFVEVTLDIAIKWDTWDLKLLDAGYSELTSRTVPGPPIATVDTWTKIVDPFGQEASEPVPLNGAGRKLAPGADPVFLRGVPENYRLRNFTTLLGI